MKISKCENFIKLYCVSFEKNHNFESYQIMQTILGFIFFYISYNFFILCHLHYTPFTCRKELFKF